MIYLTGDTHGEFKYRFAVAGFPEQRNMSKDDYVIICGDFGGIWEAGGESKQEKYWLDWFGERPFINALRCILQKGEYDFIFWWSKRFPMRRNPISSGAGLKGRDRWWNVYFS